jgi:hypothetical protein
MFSTAPVVTSVAPSPPISMFGGMSFAPVPAPAFTPTTTVQTPPTFSSLKASSSLVGDDDESCGPPPAPPDEEDYGVAGNSAIIANQASISSMFG